MDSRQSLILITVDCLRADHTGFLGYDRPTTPFLDKLATECIVFENAIVAGSPTYYSFPAIMGSRYPLALGRDVIGLARTEPSLATTLRDSCYATAAFVAGNPYLSPRYGYAEGFDLFQNFLAEDTQSLRQNSLQSKNRNKTLGSLNRGIAALSHRSKAAGSLYDELYFRYSQMISDRDSKTWDELRRFPAAEVIVGKANDWIADTGGKPFFLWLHLMDPHAPYYPQAESQQAMDARDMSASRARYLNACWNRDHVDVKKYSRYRDEIILLYDAGIRWVDMQIARLVDDLRGMGIWDNCVFALTADHGEELLEQGGRFHSPAQVTEGLIRVPLLLRNSKAKVAHSVKDPFSLIHLAPTLLSMLDFQSPDSFRGRTHWNEVRSHETWDEPAIVECIPSCMNPENQAKRLGARILCVRERQYKMIFSFDTKAELLFDLKKDPRELKALPDNERKPVRARLLRHAEKHLAASANSVDVGARLTAQLRDLCARSTKFRDIQ